MKHCKAGDAEIKHLASWGQIPKVCIEKCRNYSRWVGTGTFFLSRKVCAILKSQPGSLCFATESDWHLHVCGPFTQGWT